MKHKKSISSVLILAVLASCSPSESVITTAIAKTQNAPSSNGASSQDLCYWFFETQTLRTRRLSGLSKFTQWVQTHNLNALSTSEEIEFVTLLDEYQPYQKQFVVDWRSLGPHPSATAFWEKELESVELKIQGINEMNRGLQNNDSDLYQHGWEIFVESQAIGNAAETEMLMVRSQCVN